MRVISVLPLGAAASTAGGRVRGRRGAVTVVRAMLLGVTVGTGLAAAPVRTGDRPERPARPNVLFIAVDDLRPELACYGQVHVHTPNMDRLAARGLVFSRAYCQQAWCSPSRSSLMTGLRPDTNGVTDLETHFRTKVPDAITLPQQFKAHGYHTQSLGKIFHGAFLSAGIGRKMDDPPSWSVVPWFASPRYYFTGHGEAVAREVFSRKTGATGARVDRWTEEFVQALVTEAPDVSDSTLYDGAMTDHALEVLRELKQKSSAVGAGPFFLAVGYMKPHLPFVAPKKYWELYDPAAIQLAANGNPPRDAPAVALHDSPELRSYVLEGVAPGGKVSPEGARHLRHGYYACVSYLDAQIGRLLDGLEREGLRDNTIVVLWGDHGWQLGEHGLWGKNTNFEDATRSPLIVSVPWARARGRICPALVEFVDIYPSLCELAGLPRPPQLEGASFAPLCDAPDLPWKAAAFSQHPRGGFMGYTMRTDRFRLVVWQRVKDPGQIQAVELYDHAVDPAENVNVAGRPELAATQRVLLEQFRRGWRGALPPAAAKVQRDAE